MSDSLKPLNSQQRAFCQNMADGLSNTKAYRAAFKGVTNDNAACAAATRLLRNVKVIEFLDELRQASETKNTLSRQEKREFTAAAVRTSIFDLDTEDGKNAHLIQERTVTVTTSKNGTVTEKTIVKGVSKLDSIKIDNAMAGHNSPEDLNLNLGGGQITGNPIQWVRQNKKARESALSA